MESIVGVVCCRVQSAGDHECHHLTSSLLILHRLRAETLQFCQNPSFSSFSVALRRIYSCCYTLNKLDTSTNGNYVIYRKPRALGFLNRVVPLVSVLI